eukprot:scaffold1667_cov173-Amphora_coffeaeformis.AAC.26
MTVESPSVFGGDRKETARGCKVCDGEMRAVDMDSSTDSLLSGRLPKNVSNCRCRLVELEGMRDMVASSKDNVDGGSSSSLVASLFVVQIGEIVLSTKDFKYTGVTTTVSNPVRDMIH